MLNTFLSFLWIEHVASTTLLELSFILDVVSKLLEQYVLCIQFLLVHLIFHVDPLKGGEVWISGWLIFWTTLIHVQGKWWPRFTTWLKWGEGTGIVTCKMTVDFKIDHPLIAKYTTPQIYTESVFAGIVDPFVCKLSCS